MSAIVPKPEIMYGAALLVGSLVWFLGWSSASVPGSSFAAVSWRVVVVGMCGVHKLDHCEVGNVDEVVGVPACLVESEPGFKALDGVYFVWVSFLEWSVFVVRNDHCLLHAFDEAIGVFGEWCEAH